MHARPLASRDGTHLAFLDGLRGIAVLMVVVCHAAKYTMDFHQGWSYHMLFEGAHGVDLFFVISGYCLAYPILDAYMKNGNFNFDVLKFYCRRIVRIVPAYWVAFFALLAASLVVLSRGGDVPWPTVKIPDLASGVNQLFFLNSATNLCGSFWTLAVEFRWYLAFPLIIWLYVKQPWAVYLLGCASLIVYRFVFPNVWDFATLPGFLFGIIAADATIRKTKICRWAPLLFVGAVIASLWLEPHGHLDYALQNQVWWQVAAFFLVLAGANVPALRNVLSFRWLVTIGVAAYSIYLYHDPVEAWYGHYGGANPLVAIVAGVLVGLLSWMLVERYVTQRENRDRLVSGLEGALSIIGRGLALDKLAPAWQRVGKHAEGAASRRLAAS